MKNKIIQSPLTWDELATEYDKTYHGGRPARTLPMDKIFDWAVKQKHRFVLKNDMLFRVLK